MNNELEIDEYQYPYDLDGVYRIRYYYDTGMDVYIKRCSGNIDAKRAAIYCQFKCEEWFGPKKMLTNLGVASLLVTFYGYQQYSISPGEIIDMYHDRATFGGVNYQELMDDKTLHRDTLFEFMQPHIVD